LGKGRGKKNKEEANLPGARKVTIEEYQERMMR